MIAAANDQYDPALLRMSADELRAQIAHASILLAQRDGAVEARDAVLRIGRSIPVVARAAKMPEIAADVADKYGLTVADLKGPSRLRHIAWPRQEAFWECYQTGELSFPQIGRFFGGRDHTTVLDGARKHARRMAEAALKVAAE